MGDVTIPYYSKINEKGGYAPLDRSLSIPKENCSYAVQEAMSLFAIEDSFAESAKKLSKLFPVKVSESTIRRIIQKYGKDITETDEVDGVFSHKQPVPQPDIKSVTMSEGWIIRAMKEIHITSSPTESACRHVVGDRLKRSGMRWTEEGAQYVTSLRLKWKNNEWEDYWMNYRSSYPGIPII
jgi:hypothetical protein